MSDTQLTSRLLGPLNMPLQGISVNGRSYYAAPGQPIDAPYGDASGLEANGWTFVAPSGPTGSRPTGTLGQFAAREGQRFFDTTLGALIIFAGGAWRNPATGAAV